MRDDRPTTDLARRLRRASTETESALWRLLRSRQLEGFKFRRQHGVGRYVLDFACVEKRLCVELDGGGHAEPEQVAHDQERDAWLRSKGWRVLRFWNHESILESEAVLTTLLAALSDDRPSP